jgi:hypothetical protein
MGSTKALVGLGFNHIIPVAHQQLNRNINRIIEQEINGWLFVSG